PAAGKNRSGLCQSHSSRPRPPHPGGGPGRLRSDRHSRPGSLPPRYLRCGWAKQPELVVPSLLLAEISSACSPKKEAWLTTRSTGGGEHPGRGLEGCSCERGD